MPFAGPSACKAKEVIKTIKLPDKVQYILQTLQEHGYEAYIVGGCVRDFLRGYTPHDWDVCTSALPAVTQKIFTEKNFSVIETGIKHGTVTIVIESEVFEITTFRVDGDYTDGRHPDEVVFTPSLVDDLSRRDFTMNAMAYSDTTGLIDPYGGAEAIADKVIRCVGNPSDRFREDALRIMRAIRFASVIQFEIAEDVKKSIHESKYLLHNISSERLRDELCKTLIGSCAGKVLKEFRDVFAVFIPELAPMFDFEQDNPWHIHDVWTHTVVAVDNAPQNLTVRLVMLFHDIGKPVCYTADDCGTGHFHGHGESSRRITESVMHRLRFPKQEIAQITQLVGMHDHIIETNLKSARRLINKVGIEQARRLFSIRIADISAQAPDKKEDRIVKAENLLGMCETIAAEKQCVSLSELAVNGDDLIQLGYKSGPELGCKLQELLSLVLDFPEKNTKEELLRIVANN